MRNGNKGSKYFGKFKTGDTYGHWTVMSGQLLKDQKGRRYVDCTCTSCGTVMSVPCHHLIKGRSTRCGTCNLSYKGRGAAKNPHWRGIGEVPKTVLTKLSASAVITNTPYNISTAYVNDLYTISNGQCSYTGQPISFADGTAQITSVVQELGYTEGNVAIVHSDVKPFLKKLSPNKFIELCCQVAQKYQGDPHE